MDENSPASTGNMGSIPDPRIPHVTGQLSLCTLEPVLHSKRSHHKKQPAHRNEDEPLLAATRESPHAARKTQRSQKSELCSKRSLPQGVIYI